MTMLAGYIVPGLPHPLLAPERNAGWARIRAAFERARSQIAEAQADLLLLYSTQWVSVIGHQIQADPAPEWVHVDQEWHMLGSMPYRFRIDPGFAAAYREAAAARGLHARTVAYRGFPIDTGSIVALKLLDPDNRLAAGIVSCNMYADRSETLVLGKAAADAIAATGKRAILCAVTSLSSRMHTRRIDPAEDRISSSQDDEWNRKLLELLGEGRLEDVSQLARQFDAQAHADSKLKAVWWLAAAMGQHNRYRGEVLEYQPIWGTGGAVVRLTPSPRSAQDKEFDEDDLERFQGDRDVLTGAGTAPARATEAIVAAAAPRPVGAYPHARRVGDFLFLSGIGPRNSGDDAIPGGPVRDAAGKPLDYDVAAQTEAVIRNLRVVLEAAGSSLEKVLDVTVFLIDMDRDFKAFNEVYARHFAPIGATRTTVAVKALPTPIAVEFKALASAV